jgi:hypothetical protein
MGNRSRKRCIWLALAVIPALLDACRSEPELAQQPPSAPRETEAPRLETRTKVDRQTGKLLREWSVLVYVDKPPQKHGVEKMYYSNGKLEWSREFDHGQPHGAWRSWYQDGKPRSECFFGDPNVDTLMTWWYPGGQVQSHGPARNGAHRGLWRYYYKRNGQLAEEGEYFDNQKHGEWRAWSEDGKVLTLRQYVKGVRVSEKPGPTPAPSAPVEAAASAATSTSASAPTAKPQANSPTNAPAKPAQDPAVAPPTPVVAPHVDPVPTPKPSDGSDEDERPPK